MLKLLKWIIIGSPHNKRGIECNRFTQFLTERGGFDKSEIYAFEIWHLVYRIGHNGRPPFVLASTLTLTARKLRENTPHRARAGTFAMVQCVARVVVNFLKNLTNDGFMCLCIYVYFYGSYNQGDRNSMVALRLMDHQERRFLKYFLSKNHRTRPVKWTSCSCNYSIFTVLKSWSQRFLCFVL